MKTTKKLLILFSMVLFSFQMQGQIGIQVGGGLAFGTWQSDIGIQLNSHFEITEEWEGSGSFTFFFAGDGYDIWTLDLDAHYVFEGGDGLYYWPQAGLNITNYSIPGFSGFGGASFSDVSISIGGGAEKEFTDSMSGVVGLKYVLSGADQLVASATVLFRLQ
jgi:hypothetical protein